MQYIIAFTVKIGTRKGCSFVCADRTGKIGAKQNLERHGSDGRHLGGHGVTKSTRGKIVPNIKARESGAHRQCKIVNPAPEFGSPAD